MIIYYIFYDIFQDFFRFFKFWYQEAIRFIFDEFVKNFLFIEKNFSIRLNLKHFFKPLYGIRSIEAYFYAIPLRIILISISLFLHFFNTLVFLIIFLIWIIFPILSIFIFKFI